MIAELSNVTTSDAYTEANTIRLFGIRQLVWQVSAGASVRYQLGRGRPGVVWGPEQLLGPVVGIVPVNCDAVRIRSGKAGTPAQVTLTARTEEEF